MSELGPIHRGTGGRRNHPEVDESRMLIRETLARDLDRKIMEVI